MKKGRHLTGTDKINTVHKENMETESAAWPVNWRCGQTAYWWRRHVVMAVGGGSERRDWK